ncbi:MAG: sodium:solute symporter family protein [bacterium]
MTVAIIAGYLAVLVGLGLLARRRARPGDEDFFLAGRSFGPVLLLATMAATNFSSFTVFGFAGEGYRSGWAWYPIMAFGTGFMALSFIFLGIPVARAGRRLGAMTPPELIRLRFGNRWLHAAYLAVMVVFTLPYLALQPLGAGYALSGLTGLPPALGAVLVTVIGVGYLLLAGLRGDAWTDALQGLVMLAALVALCCGLAGALGGFARAQRLVAETVPGLFSRPGPGNITPGIWFSYLFLWFVCDPMFPQLFQRFLAARDERALARSAALYPVVCAVLFFLPVAIGVMGRLVAPGLEGSAADQVLAVVAAEALPGWAAAAVLAAGVAALMSTMDSQLLVLSAMVVRDLPRVFGRERLRFPGRRASVVLLAGIGLVLAVRPAGTMLAIATQAFTGLAVLFPVTVAAAYWRGANPWAGLASIVAGQALVALYHFKLLPAYGFLPVVPVVLASAAVLVAGSLLFPARGLEPWARTTRSGLWRSLVFGLVFLAALDFPAWPQSGSGWFGLPTWLPYHIGLCLLLSLVIARLGRAPQQVQSLRSRSVTAPSRTR